MTTDKFTIDELQLLSGAPISVPGLGLKIYQPKLYEIAELGEELFYYYLSFFKINKELVLSNIKDSDQRFQLEISSEYEVFKMVIDDQEEIKKGITTILNLVFRDMEIIKFNDSFIFLRTKEGQQYIINDQSFLLIKEIIYTIFNINKKETESSSKDFNPGSDLASDIAEKLRKRKEALERLKKASESSQGKKDQSILADFVSILAVGLSLSLNHVLNLTLYQLFNLMNRFNLYSQYQSQIQAMLQGAEDIELVDWFKKI